MIPLSRLPYSVQIQAKGDSFDVGTQIYYLSQVMVVEDHENDIGMPVEVWITVGTIQADIQPLGGELAQKQYGIVEAGITMRMFCNPSDEVQLARQVVWDGKTYEIRYVAPYRGHIEALLRPVM